jgi:hypothetical protein
MGCRELEQKLDRVFSEDVRLSHADNSGVARCITCGKADFWRNMHCGHYITRKVKATRFDEMNCRPQCASCNTYHEGRHYRFRRELARVYGEYPVAQLEFRAEMGGSLDRWQLRQKIAEYGEKAKALKKEKGREAL